MAEFGQFLGPAIANAGQQLGGYFDQRDKQKRENQILAMEQQAQSRALSQKAAHDDRDYALNLRTEDRMSAPKPQGERQYKTPAELRLAILTGQHPDPNGELIKALDYIDEQDFKQQQTLRSISHPEGGGQDKPVVPQIIKGMNTLRGADVASNRVGGGLPYNYQPPADSALASQSMLGLGYSPGNRQWDSLKSVSLGNPYPPPSNAGFQGMGSLRMADRVQQPASNVSNGSDPDTQFRSMYDDWDSLSEQEKQAVRQYHAGGGR